MFITKRPLVAACYAASLTLLVASCDSFKATDKMLYKPVQTGTGTTVLPPEHVGDLPTQYLSTSGSRTVASAVLAEQKARTTTYAPNPSNATANTTTHTALTTIQPVNVSVGGIKLTPTRAETSANGSYSATYQINGSQGTSSDGTIALASLSIDQIKQLQQGLIDQGFNPDRMSGVIGAQTEDALGAFMAYNYPGLPLQRRVLEKLGVTF